MFFRRAETIIGVSDVICKEYERRTSLDVKKIPPLIPFRLSTESKSSLRRTNGIEEEANVFMYVGSLKALKCPEIIIDALDVLGTSYLRKNKILFVFAGDGNLKENLEEKVDKLELRNHVRFLGNVEREEVCHLYKLSDYYIISSDFEGTPLSMLEAMFNRLPILASNVSGINSIITNGQNGLLFDNKNRLDLANKISYVTSNVSTLKEMVFNADEYYACHFNYENVIKEYRKVIDEI